MKKRKLANTMIANEDNTKQVLLRPMMMMMMLVKCENGVPRLKYAMYSDGRLSGNV